MAHKTTINGTSYEVVGGRALVDGTGHDIKDGMALVDGTAYKVAFRNLIEFISFGVSCIAEEGMTWAEWIDSDYNNDSKYSYDTQKNMVYYGYYYVAELTSSDSGGLVRPNDLILEGAEYGDADV